MTHDYKRNGTTSLYAALEIATGEVTGFCYPQHTHQEFLAFLNRLVKAYPAGHCTSCWTTPRRTPPPRSAAGWSATSACTFISRPTSASWMNMIEIWFSILTTQQVRRGVYHDVPKLITAIEHYIDGYNQRAQPFIWTKTADQVLDKAAKSQATSPGFRS